MLKRPDDPPPPDRHKRFRRRQKAGVAVALVEFDGAVIDFLVKTHWLADAEASDRSIVARAITAMLADAARR
jgi:hypothetical protein